MVVERTSKIVKIYVIVFLSLFAFSLPSFAQIPTSSTPTSEEPSSTTPETSFTTSPEVSSTPTTEPATSTPYTTTPSTEYPGTTPTTTPDTTTPTSTPVSTPTSTPTVNTPDLEYSFIIKLNDSLSSSSQTNPADDLIALTQRWGATYDFAYDMVKKAVADVRSLQGAPTDQAVSLQLQNAFNVMKNMNSQRSKRAASTNTSVVSQFVYLVSIDKNKGSLAQAELDFRHDPHIEWVQDNSKVKVASVPNDALYNQQYALQKIHAANAWDKTQGAGMVVAVIDSGVDFNHPDLQHNIWTNPNEIPNNGIDDDHNGYVDDVQGWNFLSLSAPTDRFGHGSHVAGIIAAEGNNGIGVVGLAYKAKIMPLKAISDTGTGYSVAVANAIIYAAQNGADVIDDSWVCDPACPSNPVIEDAVRLAHNLGVVIVASAGNSAVNVRDFSPQNMPEVITVAASDSLDEKASDSNIGSAVALSAPGVGILSVQAGTSDYVAMGGTSMAAAHVSGAAALVLATHPNFTPDDVKFALQESVDPFDLPGGGRLNAQKAVNMINVLKGDITSPLDGGVVNTANSTLSIVGTAMGTNFLNYSVSYSSYDALDTWIPLVSNVTTPVTNGPLASWNISSLDPDIYGLRLQINGSDGSVLTKIIYVSVPQSQIQNMDADPSVRGIAIEGTKVAWFNDQAQVFLYDLTTHQKTQIATIQKMGAGLGGVIGITNGMVVWTENANFSFGKIGVYNIADQSTHYLNFPGYVGTTVIKDGKIFNYNVVGSSTNYFIYDLTTNQRQDNIPKYSLTEYNSTWEGNTVYYLDSANPTRFNSFVIGSNQGAPINLAGNDSQSMDYPKAFNGRVLLAVSKSPFRTLNLGMANVQPHTFSTIGSLRPMTGVDFLKDLNYAVSLNKVAWVDQTSKVGDILNVLDQTTQEKRRIAATVSHKNTIALNDQYLLWADNQGISLIDLSFKPNFYNITASAGTGGTISPSGNVHVPNGTNQTFTVTPSTPGFTVQVLVDDQPVTLLGNTYTFPNVSAEHKIVASFTPITYSITASTNFGGTIGPLGDTKVAYWADQQFTIVKFPGYDIGQVLVDGAAVSLPDGSNTYTFHNVTAPHTIVVNFVRITYTINASAGPKGTISPSGNVIVNFGATQDFTVTPEAGYSGQVSVDGGAPVAVVNNKFSLSYITASHTVTASFSTTTYPITASATTGGTINPSGVINLIAGSSQFFQVQANPGYIFNQLRVDGNVVAFGNSYTLTNVAAPHTVQAEYITFTYKITASAGAGGTISPVGTTTVTGTNKPVYTFTPKSGYVVDYVKVDGGIVPVTNNKVTVNLPEDISTTLETHTIAVIFRKL